MNNFTHICILVLTLARGSIFSQITLFNFNFNEKLASSYSEYNPILAVGIAGSVSSTEILKTAAGIKSGNNSFSKTSAVNSVILENSSGNKTKYWEFEISGPNLINYKNLEIYFQTKSSSTGAKMIQIEYSKNGTAFVGFPSNTYAVTDVFSEAIFTLPTNADNPTNIKIRILASGALGTGSLNLDNFQIQGKLVVLPCTNPINITNIVTNIAISQVLLNWTNTTCVDEVMIIAKANTTIAGTPTGDGTSYTPNSDFSAGGTSFDGSGKVVYKGKGTNSLISGLINNTLYFFKIFTRKGTVWSSGIETIATPTNSLYLQTGDIAILGFNATISAPHGTGEELIIVFFKDIVLGTVIHITDNAFNKCNGASVDGINPGLSTPDVGWGETEGWIALTYHGNTPFPAGQTMTLRINVTGPTSGTVIVTAPTASGWVGTPVSPPSFGAFKMNSNGEQLFFLTGGIPGRSGTGSASATTNRGTYTGGRFLYSFNTKGDIWTPRCVAGGLGTENSAKPADFDCFSAFPTTKGDYNLYTGNLAPTSQSDWIGRIGLSSNWTNYTTSGHYLSVADPTFTTFSGANSGRLLDINTGAYNAAIWKGSKDNNWFDCMNWVGKNVPDIDTDVIISTLAIQNVSIDSNAPFSDNFNDVATAKNLLLDQSELKINATQNNKLHIAGDITIAGMGTLNASDGNENTPDGMLTIGGNWLNTVSDTKFVEGQSTVTFSSTEQQNISNTNTHKEVFYNIEIAKPEGNVTLLSSIEVCGVLSLTSGIINTTAANRLTLLPDASTFPLLGNATSYVNGPLDRQKNTNSGATLYFPIGKTPNWKPLELAVNHHTTTSYTYSAEMTNNSAAILGWDLQTALQSIAQVSPIRYYDIDRYASTNLSIKTDADLVGNSSVKLTYDTDEFVSPSNLIIAKNTSTNQTKWHNIGGTGAVGSSGMITSEGNINKGKTDFTTFSRFALGIVAVPLPIRIHDFKVQSTKNFAYLSWKAIGKIERIIEIEKSIDGLKFFSIGKMFGNKHPNKSENIMNYTDFSFNSHSYYRLKFGDNQYSESLHAKYTIAESSVEIFPNPFVQSFTITFPTLQHGELSISDLSGKVVYIQTFEAEQRLMLNPDIDAGLYLLKINTLENSHVVKLMHVK